MAMECSGFVTALPYLFVFSFMTICPIATGQIFIVNMTQLLVKRMNARIARQNNESRTCLM